MFKKIASFFGSGIAKAMTDSATDVNALVERWKPSAASTIEAAKEIQAVVDKGIEVGIANTQSAREHDQPLSSGINLLDGIINGVNRLVRPAVTIGILGSWFGWWELTPLTTLDPTHAKAIEIVLLFWFGGRTIAKDLPAGIAFVMERYARAKK